MYGPSRNRHSSFFFFFLLYVTSTFVSYPLKPCPMSQGSQMDLFPSRLCQPVARQQRSHLSPLQHAENNLRCACARGTGMCPHTQWRKDSRKHNHAEPRCPVGKKLAITELGKPMLPCEEESDVI